MKKRNESAAEWRALLAKKEDEIASLNRQVEWLTQQLRLMQGQRFGASSKRTQVIISEQFSLFNEAEELAEPKAAEPDREQISYKRRKQAGKRELDFSRLPTEQVVNELPEEERVCPECGGTLHQCGQTVALKFTDTLKSLPKEVRDRSPARVGLDYCDKLFQLENNFTEQKLSFQERYQARLEHSEPNCKEILCLGQNGILILCPRVQLNAKQTHIVISQI